MFDERIARFVLRPNMDGKYDKLILGCSFQSGRLKPGVVYEIVDFMGQIMIREVGESACKMTRPDSKGDSWTWPSFLKLIHYTIDMENMPAIKH